MKITVLGSRDQLCIHPDVKTLETSSDKISACREKVHRKTCVFHRNFESRLLLRKLSYLHSTIIKLQFPNQILSNYHPWILKI